MVTGHFQILQFMKDIPNPRFVLGNDATSRWMFDHPNIYQNALAGVTLEHLGCTMWTDDVNGEVLFNLRVRVGHHVYDAEAEAGPD